MRDINRGTQPKVSARPSVGGALVWLPALVLLLGGPACQHEATELEDVEDAVGFEADLSVFGLISAREFIHTVSVERSFHPIESGFEPYLAAEVYLSSEDVRQRLRKQSGLTSLYWTSQFELRIVPGRRVYLEVIWNPNLGAPEEAEEDSAEVEEKLPIRRVTASTIPPGSFRIVRPASGLDTTRTTEFPVAWTASEHAYGYLVYAMNSLVSLQRTFDAATRDTSFVIPYLLNTPGNYNIEVWAVDENYYSYYLSRPNDPLVPVENLVEGGQGVFASYDRDRVTVTILDDLILLGE